MNRYAHKSPYRSSISADSQPKQRSHPCERTARTSISADSFSCPFRSSDLKREDREIPSSNVELILSPSVVQRILFPTLEPQQRSVESPRRVTDLFVDHTQRDASADPTPNSIGFLPIRDDSEEEALSWNRVPILRLQPRPSVSHRCLFFE